MLHGDGVMMIVNDQDTGEWSGNSHLPGHRRRLCVRRLKLSDG